MIGYDEQNQTHAADLLRGILEKIFERKYKAHAFSLRNMDREYEEKNIFYKNNKDQYEKLLDIVVAI